jgi:hypothetical protein
MKFTLRKEQAKKNSKINEPFSSFFRFYWAALPRPQRASIQQQLRKQLARGRNRRSMIPMMDPRQP